MKFETPKWPFEKLTSECVKLNAYLDTIEEDLSVSQQFELLFAHMGTLSATITFNSDTPTTTLAEMDNMLQEHLDHAIKMAADLVIRAGIKLDKQKIVRIVKPKGV